MIQLLVSSIVFGLLGRDLSCLYRERGSQGAHTRRRRLWLWLVVDLIPIYLSVG